ncbi:MAG TPA: hypothetical protein EYQ42_04665 [Thiotrichaceae bacterium]|nr:hypothetical protein [Thiotrichaceae bacterium]
MNPQKESKLVRYYADNHLIVIGNLYQLIDNISNQLLFLTVSSSDGYAVKQCALFLRSEWEKS